uniref:Uncharacterized protein n=1 Tax=Arundo donax TaxID=35708 RepID=A0A0A9ETP5_ARUDO
MNLKVTRPEVLSSLRLLDMWLSSVLTSMEAVSYSKNLKLQLLMKRTWSSRRSCRMHYH